MALFFFYYVEAECIITRGNNALCLLIEVKGFYSEREVVEKTALPLERGQSCMFVCS